MSKSIFEQDLEIHIDDPGYGTIYLRYTGNYALWEARLSGRQLGALLREMTARALAAGYDQYARAAADSTVVPSHIDSTAARRLLPLVQRAILLAGSGTERYQRMYDPAPREPEPPLCGRCGADGIDEPLTSPWCAEYGHSPFGLHDEMWQHAVAKYDEDLARARPPRLNSRKSTRPTTEP